MYLAESDFIEPFVRCSSDRQKLFIDSTPMENCARGGHVTSRNQGLSSKDERRQRKENLGTRLVYAKESLICVKIKSNRNETPFDTEAKDNSEMAY